MLTNKEVHRTKLSELRDGTNCRLGSFAGDGHQNPLTEQGSLSCFETLNAPQKTATKTGATNERTGLDWSP